MEIKKLHMLIKRKFYFKYITLVCILFLYVPLVGIIVTQFEYKECFWYYFIGFIALFIGVIVMNMVYEKVFVLPDIDSADMLYKYLNYFTLEHRYLQYTEAITWFYRKIQAKYQEKRDVYTNMDNVINQLHRVLRPRGNHTTSFAMEHMDAFRRLSSEVISSYNETKNNFKELTLEEMDNFRNEETEKHYIVDWLHDKNLLIYLLVFPIHIFGCILLSLSDKNTILWKSFVGNFFLYIPTDFIAILLYKGIMKSNK